MTQSSAFIFSLAIRGLPYAYVQAAIADFYKSMKDHPALWMLCNKLGVDYDTILEEECRRALNKYLK
jgi:hypothetical protein